MLNKLADTNSATPPSSVYLPPCAPSPGTLTTLSRTLRSRSPAAPCISPGRPTSFSGPPVCGNPLWRGNPSLEPPWRSAVIVSSRSVSHKTCLRSCSFNLAGEPRRAAEVRSAGGNAPVCPQPAPPPPAPSHGELSAPPTDPQLPGSTWTSVCGSHGHVTILYGSNKQWWNVTKYIYTSTVNFEILGLYLSISIVMLLCASAPQHSRDKYCL